MIDKLPDENFLTNNYSNSLKVNGAFRCVVLIKYGSIFGLLVPICNFSY